MSVLRCLPAGLLLQPHAQPADPVCGGAEAHTLCAVTGNSGPRLPQSKRLTCRQQGMLWLHRCTSRCTGTHLATCLPQAQPGVCGGTLRFTDSAWAAVQALCINDDALRLGSLPRINERCQELRAPKPKKQAAQEKGKVKARLMHRAAPPEPSPSPDLETILPSLRQHFHFCLLLWSFCWSSYELCPAAKGALQQHLIQGGCPCRPRLPRPATAPTQPPSPEGRSILWMAFWQRPWMWRSWQGWGA